MHSLSNLISALSLVGAFFLCAAPISPLNAIPVDQAFSYDALNRLTAAAQNTYSYDAAGNLLGITGAERPNLVPYIPSGWDGQIVVSRELETNTDSLVMTATDTLYVDWAVTNGGLGAAGAFQTRLYVDNVLRHTWNTASLQSYDFAFVEDYNLGSLPVGAHTLRIVTDSQGVLTETDEEDNEHSRTFHISVVHSFLGTTLGRPSWTRPHANDIFEPVDLSSVQAAYDMVSFTVPVSGTYFIEETAVEPVDWDNYLFLYTHQFNPVLPLTHVTLGNDDYQRVGLSRLEMLLEAGTVYFLISTGFANDSQGAYSAIITGPSVPSFLPVSQSWRQQYFGTTTNSGSAADGADFDHDGVANLLEWASGQDPTATNGLPTAMQRAGSSLEFDYQRSVSALNAGTAFTVEWSAVPTSLGPWSTTGITETILSTSDGVQQVRAVVPMAGQARRFVRLKVTGP